MPMNNCTTVSNTYLLAQVEALTRQVNRLTKTVNTLQDQINTVGGTSTTEFTDGPDTIQGDVDGINTVFQVSHNYILGSTKVYVGGLRYWRGLDYDYLENGLNQITFNIPPEEGTNIVVDYTRTD